MIDVPHPFVTVVVGAEGIANGVAAAEAAALVHPDTV
jgi:hypothetical protein